MRSRITSTNAADPQKRFSLAEMSAVFLDRARAPVGFFVSGALWRELSSRMQQQDGSVICGAPVYLQGVKIMIDPSLPDAEFDVAFTEGAWSARLRQLDTCQRGEPMTDETRRSPMAAVSHVTPTLRVVKTIEEEAARLVNRKLACPGVARDAENDQALCFYFNRKVSDDEMRYLHEVMQRAAACQRPEGAR